MDRESISIYEGGGIPLEASNPPWPHSHRHPGPDCHCTVVICLGLVSSAWPPARLQFFLTSVTPWWGTLGFYLPSTECIWHPPLSCGQGRSGVVLRQYLQAAVFNPFLPRTPAYSPHTLTLCPPTMAFSTDVGGQGSLSYGQCDSLCLPL